mmetsp:Transcript_4977/g.5450  ORF Transcript_4977/g.5450 Transcript_4977/m.5450 type:complete len:142 (-) Transcript_4977:228-653(-)|eukprot:gene3256-3469_t
MSSALVWQLIKDHNSFLVKRGRTHRAGAVQFSAEKGNLLNVNSAKYSGLASNNSVGVTTDLQLVVKDSKHATKPNKLTTTEKLTLHTGKSGKKVAEVAKSVRADLARTATLRYKKAARALSAKKGYSKRVVKSSARGKLTK